MFDKIFTRSHFSKNILCGDVFTKIIRQMFFQKIL